MKPKASSSKLIYNSIPSKCVREWSFFVKETVESKKKRIQSESGGAIFGPFTNKSGAQSKQENPYLSPPMILQNEHALDFK